MAYLKIFPVKVTDKKALDYITNPDKTDEKLLVSSFGCSPETADLEFSMTREMAKKNGMDKGDNLAFHLIQSFKPGEVDAETAHRLGQQFVDEVLKGKYEYVISTHVDKNHIHNHIIFNAASFVDHHKYVSNKRSYHKICRISNRICHENGLATSMPTGEKGKSYKENMEYHRGTSWKAKLRVAVDKAIWTSINYEEFLQKMQLAGYEVRQGKHLSFRAPEQKNFTYMKSLGSYYSEENVRIRLAKNRSKVKAPKHLTREARLYINISTYVTTGNREGFERWAKLNNLKEAARTFNYLSEKNLLNYEDFKQHVSDVDASVKAAEQRIAQIDSELNTQKIIQKHCDSYRLCRKVIEDCKSAKNPKAYRTKYQAEYKLHDSLKKELQDLGVTKIPSSNKIQKRIENLESELAATVREKQEFQKKQKTLDIIKQNFTALLNAPEMQVPVSKEKKIVAVTAPGTSGNAVVAACGADGEILWSWHLWIADYDPAASLYTTPANASGTTWTFMDRNVGATTNAPDSFDCHGMIYQWGRKDPFTSAGTFTIINEDYSYQVDGERPIYNILNEELPKMRTRAEYHGTIAKSLRNPAVFYAMTYNFTGERALKMHK